MSIEEKKLREEIPEEDLERPLTPQEEMKRRRYEMNFMQNL